MSAAGNNGLVSISVHSSVNQVVEKLKDMMRTRGITLFAVIDHSGEAAKAGLEMPNTKLLIFGNPKAGTPVMVAAPSLAIDLPLKMLVAEDRNGDVSITYNSAEFLAERHGVPADLMKVLRAVEGIAAAVAGQ